MQSAGRSEPRILILDSDPGLVDTLCYELKDGFVVDVVDDPKVAAAAIDRYAPDVVVLSWAATVLSLHASQDKRRERGLPKLIAIVLAPSIEDLVRVQALQPGADYYGAKPVSASELSARIRVLLRSSRPGDVAEVVTYAGVVLDLPAHRVLRNGRAIHVGPTEFKLLRYLLERPGIVCSRQQLVDAVWPCGAKVSGRAVDVSILRLRKALNGPGEPDVIRTVRDAGYSIDEIADELLRPNRMRRGGERGVTVTPFARTS